MLFILSTLVLVLIRPFEPENYESAKKAVGRFLASNEEALEEIAIRHLESDPEAAAAYKAAKSIAYSDYENAVVFDIDAQGMLGGQYWYLFYTADGHYTGQAAQQYFPENKRYVYEQENGNNIMAVEHLHGNWFFAWMDYDGREDLTYKYIR